MQPGIDQLTADPERFLGRARRVALLANQASLTSDWTPSVDALLRVLGPALVALLSPEHGFSGFGEDATAVDDSRDPHTGLPIFSLYGPRRRLDADVIKRFDAVVIDLQEVGVRCYTYATTMALVLEAARDAGVDVLVCDRPNLLGPEVDGPMLEPGLRSFLGYLPVPYQHGLTLGELARSYARSLGGAPLRVVKVGAWRRADPLSPERFVPPSPGLPSLPSVRLYPGLVMLEGTSLSEGRGTSLPFELLGGEGVDGYELARDINSLAPPGLRARPLDFVPESGKLRGRHCGGVQLHVTEQRALRPLTSVARILRLLSRRSRFAWVDSADLPWSANEGAGEAWHEPVRGHLVDGLLGSSELRHWIDRDDGLEVLDDAWLAGHRAFLDSVEGDLLYADAPVSAAAASAT